MRRRCRTLHASTIKIDSHALISIAIAAQIKTSNHLSTTPPLSEKPALSDKAWRDGRRAGARALPSEQPNAGQLTVRATAG